jgi:hypothetical protein
MYIYNVHLLVKIAGRAADVKPSMSMATCRGGFMLQMAEAAELSSTAEIFAMCQ